MSIPTSDLWKINCFETKRDFCTYYIFCIYYEKLYFLVKYKSRCFKTMRIIFFLFWNYSNPIQCCSTNHERVRLLVLLWTWYRDRIHTSVFKFLGVTFIEYGVVSTQLAFQVQPKRTQVEAQYWGNPKVARLEGTPARLIWSRHSHTQIYKQTRNRTEHTSVITI